MKKYINKMCAVALMALCALPAMAQLNGSGYYRFRNAQNTSDYISIANDKFNYTTVISTAGGGLTALALSSAAKTRAMQCATKYLQNDIHMINDPDVIDLASVIYAQKRNAYSTNYEYNLIGQGTSLLTLTSGTYPGGVVLTFENLYVTISSVSGSGANTLYTASMALKASNNSMADLGVRYFVDESGKFDTDVSSVASQDKARWYIEQVTHFNVLPEVELNGKYYTTLKAPFAVQLSGQVEKAYKITANNSGVLEYEVIASTGGTVPAGTPVLLQCSSPNAADCQLIPTGVPVFTAANVETESGAPAATDVTTPTSDNLLAGTYYCNTDGSISFSTSSGTSSFNGNHNVAAGSKYVIGKDANGKLGFVLATGQGLTYMPANKAWTLSAGLFPTLATPSFSLSAGTYTGAQSVTITAEDGATIEYSTDGGNTWQTYTEAINVAETTTIQARAIKPGLYNNSNVASAEYVIETVSVNLGDVNGDGIVDINDVTCLIDHLLGLDVEEYVEANADVDQDNEISINDVTTLIDALLGIITL